jgi:hexosaminidase
MGSEYSFNFLCDVLKEVFELFPGKLLHLGGDEVFKANWIACKACMDAARQNELQTPHQMQVHFMNRFVEFANQYGKRVILWNDAFVDASIHTDAICQYWNPIGKRKKIFKTIRQNRTEVIDSNASAYYFDYPNGVISLESVYRYESVFVREDHQLKGLELALWTERVHTKARAYDLLFPRLFAFAENAWSFPEQRNYAGFRQRLISNKNYFEKYGITLHNMNQWESKGFRSIVERVKFIRTMMSKKLLHTIRQMNKINHMRFR